jgi:hypothetical protein
MRPKTKLSAVLRVYWSMLRIYLFYPLMIAAFLYVYVKDYHWIWGLFIIIGILIIDPIYRILWRSIRRKIKSKNKGR